MIEVIRNRKKIAQIDEPIVDVQASPFVGLRIKTSTLDFEIECIDEIGVKIRNVLDTIAEASNKNTIIQIDMDTGGVKLLPGSK
ncbi:MAG: hypothetical protein GXO10_06270 [Crenarchaeota archaeon]|nr:hypothetical protein [Thermoproteota archaeon]